MRVAIIHYWLVGMRGGEKVLEALCRLFPRADIHTHVYVPQAISPAIKQHRIATTFIARLPFAPKLYQHYLPLMPLALEQLDLRGYDLVISSESGPAKGVLAGADTPHICYCHTPMRYLWDFYHEYLNDSGFFTRQAFRLCSHRLRQWDVLSALRVDHFAANSHAVARRIARCYHRQATVIHPPVDVASFAPADGVFTPPGKNAPYLCLGQLVGYKRADLAVAACTAMRRPLVVAGDGPMRRKLEKTAGPSVRFIGHQNQEEVRSLLRGCRALLFPGEEDFGIVPVEAQAAGRAVIAYGRGGALETVAGGESGLFFSEQTPEALCEAVERFEREEGSFDPTRIAAGVRRFAPEHFDAAFMDLVRTAAERGKAGGESLHP